MEDSKLVNFMLHKRAIFISAAIFIASALSLIGISIYVNLTNKTEHTISDDIIISRNTKKRETTDFADIPGCQVIMEIPIRNDGVLNCWHQEEDDTWGSQYDIYIVNNTKTIFTDWVLTVTVPQKSNIDSSWNGTYEKNENKIKIQGSEETLTKVIFPKSYSKLGFVLYSKNLLTESSFLLTTKMQIQLLRYKPFIIASVFTAVGFFILILAHINYWVLKQQQNRNEKEISEFLKLCASFIDTRDKYTKKHSYNVATYSKMLAEELGYNTEFQKNIFSIGMLHDIGKVLIPREILCKPGKLTAEEWEEMKNHTTYGAEILKDFKGIKNVRTAAMYHHERYDGKGYMEGLAGNEIPLEARIVCVADSFDAMATDRAYRPHLSKEVILSELENGKGTQFDPKIAQAMIDLINSGKTKI